MGINKALLRNLGMASAFVVIVIAVLSQTDPPLVDDTEGCMDMFSDLVFVSEQHCVDEVEKCTAQYKPEPYERLNIAGCMMQNGIMQK